MAHRRALVRAIVGGMAGALVAAGSALAALSASVANLSLPAVTSSHTAQVSTGTMTLTASDNAFPVGLGWNVTIQASSFVYSGPNNGTNIPASSFALTSAAAPVRVSGQAVDATSGPKVPAASPLGTLNVARKVLQSNALFGVGTYTQALGVSLTLPAETRAGTYTTSLTTTISLGP
jgi:hypothetical protein